MTHVWELSGFDNAGYLVSSIPLPRVLWPLLSELANIPEPATLTYFNCGDWPISEAHARALARVAMGTELVKDCEWFASACV